MRRLLLLFLCATAIGQATNPQNTYVSSVLVNSPSTYLNFNDATTAFRDQTSGLVFGAMIPPPAGNGQTIVGAFNGTNTYLTSASVSTFSTPALSLNAWIYVGALVSGSYSLVVGTADTGTNSSFQIMVKGDGTLAVYVSTSAGTVDYDGTGSHTLIPGNWYLLSATYDSVNGLKGYVNASVDGTVAANGTIITTAGSLIVGGNFPCCGGRYLTGLISRVSAYNLSLTSTQVTTLYGGGTVSSNLIGQWNINEGTGSTAVDSSAGGNNLTWNGTAVGMNGTHYINNSNPNVTLRQPGFDATINTNYSAGFPYNAWNSAPNTTLGAIEWSSPASIMVHVDRLNWSRTGQLVLASKGDVGSTANNYWEIVLKMSGVNSQLCFTRNSTATPSTAGASGLVSQAVCSSSGLDLMPNGFNYNIVITQDVTGAGSGVNVYVNGLQEATGSATGVGFGSATINATGGTGYASSTPFIGVGGGSNCSIAGNMISSGGVPQTSNGFTFSKNYGCTSTPSITFNYSIVSPMSIGQTCVVQLNVSATTANCTVSSVTAGSALLISGLPNDTTGVTDSAGTPVLYGTTPTGQGPIYYEANVTAGTHTITFTTTSTHAVYYYMQALEIKGAASTSPIDAAAYATGTGTAVAVGPVTTTGTNELVVALMQVQSTGGSGWTVPTSGFTLCSSPGNTSNCASAQAATAGSYSFSVTQAATAGWQTQLVALKPGTTTFAPTGTGVSLTYGLTGASMNSATNPLMVPGSVSGGTYSGISQATSTQPTTYIDEFAEFPSVLSFGQLSNIFYQTKFYQLLNFTKPANPLSVIFDNDGCGDQDNMFALQAAIAEQNLGYINLIGVIQTTQMTDDVAIFRQMLDQSGLANIPVGVTGTLTAGSSGGACSNTSINNFNNSTLGIVSSFPSAATVYRTAFATHPTSPIVIFTAGSPLGIAQFMQSAADSISSLTGLQLWAQDVANGGAVYMQGGGCPLTALPNTSPCNDPSPYVPSGTNLAQNPTAAVYIFANLQSMPVLWLPGTPQNTGPGPFSTRVMGDPMWQAVNLAGDIRQGWDSLPMAALVTPYFTYGVTIAVSGGTGYAASTLFTLSGGGSNCQGSGLMTASGGVPNGFTTLYGTNINALTGFSQLGIGNGCTGTPTVNLVGATGTGASFTTYSATICGTMAANVGAGTIQFTSGAGTNCYLYPGPFSTPNQSPIFSWFINSLMDEPPNRSAIQTPQ